MTIKVKKIGFRLLIFAWVISCSVGCDGNSSTTVHSETEFSAGFDSGSMESEQYLGNYRYRVQPRPDFGMGGISPTGQVQPSWDGRTWWYHFSIAIAEEYLPYPIELEIDAIKVWYKGMYSASKVPVVSCDGTTWRFANEWVSWKDGKTPTENPVITDTLTCPTTYVAMATPYPWHQMETFIESIGASPYIIRQDIIGHTQEGENQDALPLYYLLLSDPGNQPGKRNVVVISGLHPGETSNSWMLTGLVEFLLSDNAQANSVRQAFNFHIYPAVNPEGVKYGHYRRSTESTLDPNRAWNTNDVLEVEIVRSHILSQTSELADYFFDLHGSGYWNHFIYHHTDKPGASEFVETVAASHPNLSVSRGETTSALGTSASRWALYNLRSHDNSMEPPLSFIPEGSYAQGSWEGTPEQSADWKALGAALANAIFEVENM